MSATFHIGDLAANAEDLRENPSQEGKVDAC